MKDISKLLKFFLFCELLTFVSISVFSQTTGYSGTGANIDVVYYKCEWTINPGAAKNIAGSVTIRFKTMQANVSSISIDLNNTSFNNGSLSVTFHGTICSKSFSGNVLTITLPATIATISTIEEIVVNYSGVPPAVNGQAEGYQKKTVNTKQMIYTLSESYEDRDWWPCKADMQDKADSLDIYITTPSAYTAAANGVLISTTPSGGNRIFYYKHRYPIASYLVAVAVSEYTINNRGTVNINGTNMPVDYYYLSNRAPTAVQLQTMDRCKDELLAFSSNSIFGDYPFKNEKYGMYEFGWGGGMEHQTFSAMSWGSMTSWSVIAHELGHQWFGDKVTFGTWNHLWLAEGFARYMEALAAELVPTLGQSASAERLGFKNSANSVTYRGYSCFIPDGLITTSDVMWSSAYGSTVYERGAMVVSMLRMLLGDEKFYQACRNYLNDPLLAYRSATTDDLRNHMQAVAGGYDLTAFFNSYVYGNGYPLYNTSIKWGNPGANRINFKVTTQTKSTGSTVTYYHTPIALRVQGSLPTQDTVLVIYDQNGQLSRGGNGISAPIAGNYISFMLGFTPVTVTFDPFNQTLATGAAPAFDGADPLLNFSTLPVDVIDFTLNENNYSNELKLSLSDTDGELKKVMLQKSFNGIDFTDAGDMQEKAGSAVLKNFYYTDYNVYSVAYYRAKITEANTEKYSKVIKTGGNLTSGVSVYPNPADKDVIIKWSGFTMNSGAADVRIFDMDGRQVWSKTTSADFVNVSVAELPNGTYLVQVSRDKEILLNKKLMIRR